MIRAIVARFRLSIATSHGLLGPESVAIPDAAAVKRLSLISVLVAFDLKVHQDLAKLLSG